MRELDEDQPVGTAEFIFKRIGPLMEHNYLCAVCREEHAVIETWRGILQPCWGCQEKGYVLIKKKKRWWQ
jgi:hypothetical protein